MHLPIVKQISTVRGLKN